MMQLKKFKKYACVICIAVVFTGCSHFSPRQASLSPKDTISKKSIGDGNFIYKEAHYTAYGFDEEKTEYNYSMTDVLEATYFGFDRSDLNKSEEEKIKNLSLVFLNDQSLSVLVVGNCDIFGKKSYNDNLGKKRAEYVKKLLVATGISEDRIKTASLGSLKAHKHVINKQDSAIDRRCDIVVRKTQY